MAFHTRPAAAQEHQLSGILAAASAMDAFEMARCVDNSALDTAIFRFASSIEEGHFVREWAMHAWPRVTGCQETFVAAFRAFAGRLYPACRGPGAGGTSRTVAAEEHTDHLLRDALKDCCVAAGVSLPKSDSASISSARGLAYALRAGAGETTNPRGTVMPVLQVDGSAGAPRH